MVPDGNPFSTCRVRPGSLEFQFPHELPPQQLVERLASQRWWGQIVGAHGVGKSTLLHAWLPLLADAGRTVSWWTLQGGQRRSARRAVDGGAVLARYDTRGRGWL